MQNNPHHKNPNSDFERLHKRIAATGYCSRRQAEILIETRHVKVNGKPVSTLGFKVRPTDKIEIDGKPLEQKAAFTLALHKPRGILTSKTDPFHKTTVMDLLPKEFQHLNPIGRLDKDSQGLLLFTSDGALLERLTHPSYDHAKDYEVLIAGVPSDETLGSIREGGMKLDDYALRPMDIQVLGSDGQGNTWVSMRLKEGRKRQIRRVMELFNHPVLRLIRVAVGPIQLGDLPVGHWRELTEDEQAFLNQK